MPHKSKDDFNAYVRAYRKRRRVSDETWAEKRRSENRAYCEKRRQADPDYRERNRQRSAAWYARNQHRSMRRGAQQRGIVWALPDELALDLITDNCFYCGCSPETVHGIDRVDNTKGYLENNVVTACKFCNTAKLNRTLPEYLAWLKRASTHIERTNVASICV